VHSGRSLPTFRRNVLPPSSGLNSVPLKQAANIVSLLFGAYSLSLIFDPLFLRNVWEHLLDYMAHPEDVVHYNHRPEYFSNWFYWFWACLRLSKYPGRCTGQTMTRRGVGIRVPVEARLFLLPALFRPALGSTQPSIQWVPRVLSLGVKLPGRGADHSPPTSVEVKKMWIYTSTLTYAFMA
jgi:hypothetical protein